MNNMEMLQWDMWGLMSKDIETMTHEELGLLDKIAILTQAGNESFHNLREIYENDERLRFPRIIKSYSPVDKPSKVILPV